MIFFSSMKISRTTSDSFSRSHDFQLPQKKYFPHFSLRFFFVKYFFALMKNSLFFLVSWSLSSTAVEEISTTNEKCSLFFLAMWTWTFEIFTTFLSALLCALRFGFSCARRRWSECFLFCIIVSSCLRELEENRETLSWKWKQNDWLWFITKTWVSLMKILNI